MMNRGVMDRQMFRNGGMVRRMQAGGDPMMAPPAPQGGMQVDPAMAMVGTPPDPGISFDQAAAGAMQQGIDPALVESLLQQAASSYGDIDAAAENEDYEQVINAIRGDQAPLQERRQELAGIVGDADAAQTPDSVLTLVQPIMQIAAVDQGIGSMAPEAMNTPVQGDMAGGIMSTVAMPEEQPMPGAGGPAPVNFNQGGAVQYMQPGGVALPDPRQQALFEQQRALYGQLLDPTQQAADLEEQRNLTQAQMLFDIAQGALMFATPGQRNMSPAQRLAEAFTPVLGNIGARAGEFGKFKQSQKAQQRQMDLAALQSAQSMYEGELTRSAAAANVAPGDTYELRDAEGNVLYTGPVATRAEQNALREQFPDAVSFRKVTAPGAINLTTLINPNDPNDYRVIDQGNPANRPVVEALLAQRNPDGTQRYREAGLYSPSDSADRAPNIQVFVNRNNPDEIRRIDIGTDAGREEANALSADFLPVNTPSLSDVASGSSDSPLGNSFNGRFLAMISDPARMEAYATGALDQSDPDQARLLTNTLTLATQARPVWDQTLGREVMVPAIALPQQITDVIEARRAAGLPVPNIGGQINGPQPGAPASNTPTEETPGRVRFNEDGTIDFSSFENDPTYIITGVDLTQSQDWTSGVNRFFNQIAGQLQPVFGGSGYSGQSGRITSEADTQLDRLANQVMRVVRADTDGRIFALDATLLGQEVDKFRPGTFKTDNGARDALVTTRNALASMWNDTQTILMNPSEYDRGTITSARTLQAQVERLLAETTAAVSVYDRFITSNPVGDAATDRALTSPRTSTLPRASGNGN